MVGCAAAQENSAPAATLRVYGIPAQALDSALNAYIQASGVQVLYETALTKARRSSALDGRFASDVALDMLLAGTGLVARRIDLEAFVITQAPQRKVEPGAMTARPDARFLAALQAGVLEALCRSPQTRPGGYKVAVELWIAPNGAVQHVALVGSSSDAERDHLLRAALHSASIRMAPPAGFPQPFLLAIDRRSPQETGDCPG